jgi:uncharacterized integral membrane protein
VVAAMMFGENDSWYSQIEGYWDFQESHSWNSYTACDCLGVTLGLGFSFRALTSLCCATNFCLQLKLFIFSCYTLALMLQKVHWS